MSLIQMGPALAAGLFVGVLVFLEAGRRIGRRRIASGGAETGFGAVESAVFGLMGLLIAFTFSGAAARFDGRRDLVTREANAIGTAWLRIDLVPAEAQAKLRDLFRRYMDSRLATYRNTGSWKWRWPSSRAPAPCSWTSGKSRWRPAGIRGPPRAPPCCCCRP
jgi:hypothetical protein